MSFSTNIRHYGIPASAANYIAGEDEYTTNLRNIVKLFQNVPGRVSEKGVKRLASQNKFEIFEDVTPEGAKRISLGGSIVLVDIDFISAKVTNVSVSLASSLKPSNEKFSFMTGNSCEEIILKSLQEPRLDHFAEILSFLSRLDKLSSKSADCFRIFDEISNALFSIYEKKLTNSNKDLCRSLEYGVPVLNPQNSLGLGLWYWSFDDDETKDVIGETSSPKWFALFDVKERREEEENDKIVVRGVDDAEQNNQYLSSISALRYTQNWVDINDTINWSDPEPLNDTSAYLILKLEPPLIVSEVAAMKLGVPLTDGGIDGTTGPNIRHSPLLNSMNRRVGKTSRTIHNPNDSTTLIEISYANLLPYSLVQISEIPINHPKDIKDILKKLRSFLLLRKVWTSLDNKLSLNMIQTGGGKDMPIPENSHYLDQQNQDEQLSFADAIMEYETIEKAVISYGNISAIINLTTEERSNVETKDNLIPIINIGLSLFKGISFNISVESNDNPSLKVEIEAQSDTPLPASLTSNLEKLNKVLNITEDLGIFLSVILNL